MARRLRPVTDDGAGARLMARLAAQPPALVVTADDTDGLPVRVRVRALHDALNRALPHVVLTVGRDYWTGQLQNVTLATALAAIEQQMQALTVRVRQLEAAQTAPPAVHVNLPATPPPVAVERIQTVLRDANGCITGSVTRETPALTTTPSTDAG